MEKMTYAPNQNAKSNKSGKRMRHSPLLLLPIELVPCYCCVALLAIDITMVDKKRWLFCCCCCLVILMIDVCGHHFPTGTEACRLQFCFE
jgi:hypothetical protein